MSIAEAAVPSMPKLYALHPARITVEQYHAMGEAGILTPDDRVELLEGVIEKKPVKEPLHVKTVKLLMRRLSKCLSPTMHATRKDPVTLIDSEPEPDVSVLLGTIDDYADRHPSGSDCLLVIEVADTSLARDTFKASAYAAGGVPEYWIVDLTGRTFVVHRKPTADGYADITIAAEASIDLPGGAFRVAIDDLVQQPENPPQ